MPSEALALTLTVEQLRALVREELARALARPDSDVLSTEQAAEVAGLAPKTIREWVATGRLRATKRGRRLRIERGDLARAMAGDSPDPLDAAAGTLRALRRPT
jgi:excisionase family DNA binding protein